MDTEFWQQVWAQGDIGFHQKKPNPLLVDHFEKLNLVQGSRVFVPLCGKSIDITWLLSRGYKVVGIELNEPAIIEFFKELGLAPEVTTLGALIRYSVKDIDIFVGDFFELPAEYLGTVNTIYDRAALVALPPTMREQYTSHLAKITDNAPQLLIVFEYNQQLMDGPPFSIPAEEVKQHYSRSYTLDAVEIKDVKGGLKGKVTSTEIAWLLQKA